MTDVTQFPGYDPTQQPEHTLRIEREFDAPRELLYRAFVDADQLAAWFGPEGYHVPRESVDMDVRVGGHQTFSMGPVGGKPEEFNAMTARFDEVVENELLAGSEDVEGIPGFEGVSRFSLRLEFHDLGGGRSKLVVEQGPYTQFMEGMAGMGWQSSFTKLDAVLAAAA